MIGVLIGIPPIGPDLSVNVVEQKSPSDPSVTYTINVTNNGPGQAPGATVTYQIPPNTTVDILGGDGGILALDHGDQRELREHDARPDPRLQMRFAIPPDHIELDLATRDNIGALSGRLFPKQRLTGSDLAVLGPEGDQPELVGIETGEKRQSREKLNIVTEGHGVFLDRTGHFDRSVVSP